MVPGSRASQKHKPDLEGTRVSSPCCTALKSYFGVHSKGARLCVCCCFVKCPASNLCPQPQAQRTHRICPSRQSLHLNRRKYPFKVSDGIKPVCKGNVLTNDDSCGKEGMAVRRGCVACLVLRCAWSLPGGSLTTSLQPAGCFEPWGFFFCFFFF